MTNIIQVKGPIPFPIVTGVTRQTIDGWYVWGADRKWNLLFVEKVD